MQLFVIAPHCPPGCRLGPAEDLESARKRLARLRSVAERAAHLAPSGGAASPRATGSPRTAAQVGPMQGGRPGGRGKASRGVGGV